MNVESARYENESKVVRAGLQAFQRETREQEAKLASLRSAIARGDASSFAEPGVFERIRQHLQPPK